MTQPARRIITVELVERPDGWIAVVRGNIPQATYGPDTSAAGVLSLIAEDIDGPIG